MDPVPPEQYKSLRRFEVPRGPRALNFACFHSQGFLRSDRACQWLANAVIRGLEKHEVDLWAYCFMPSHAHLLVFPRSEDPSMADFLESVKKSVIKKAIAWVRTNAPSFLQRVRDEQPNGRVAHRFWQRGGGYDRNLWSPRAVWTMIDYIHRNPVAEGLCAHPTDWYWSSAGFYKLRTPGPIPISLRHLRPRP